jgi:hypothetical protein
MKLSHLNAASMGLLLLSGSMSAALAQHSAAQAAQDAQRHLVIAQAHSTAAQCLADGGQAPNCLSTLKASCAGLGIGKYCGLKEDALPQAGLSLHQTAQAHQRMAQCIGSAKPYESCLWDLQSACKGLAIGKYCGMMHAHTF